MKLIKMFVLHAQITNHGINHVQELLGLLIATSHMCLLSFLANAAIGLLPHVVPTSHPSRRISHTTQLCLGLGHIYNSHVQLIRVYIYRH
jgi:hypothetical protein